MELDEIKEIIELMNHHGLSQFDLERDDFKIRLKKGMDAAEVAAAITRATPPGYAAAPAPPPPAAPAPPAAGPAPAARDGEPPSEPEVEPAGPSVNSPMVGTFYRAPGPGEDAFVKVGDPVDEDTVVCVIEAMKVMNEIKAETSGTVAKILVDDATPVQYGQPLIELET